MSGSTIGSFVGAGIGWLIGGPAGAKWGWMIGGTLGGIIAPERIQGPRLTDAQKQTSQEGVPIPFGYGSFPCMGNLIWADVLVEHEHEEGGKGGPTQVTYTYTRSFAIGFCEGEAFVQRVKINGKLVYDISPTSTIQGQNSKFLEYATIYTGSETQVADPTMEAVLGAGNVPAHRGLCYIVFEDFDCDTHGAVPQVEVVLQKCGTLTETDGSLIDLAPRFYYPLNDNPPVDVMGNMGNMAFEGSTALGGLGVEFSALDAGTSVSGGGLHGGAKTVLIRARIDDLAGGSIIKNLVSDWTNTVFGFYHWSIHLRDGGDNMTVTVGVNNAGGAGTTVAGPEVNVGIPFVAGLRYTGSLLELIYNGAVVASAAASGSSTGSAAMDIAGADEPASYGYEGSAGHLVGWNRALSDAEVLQATLQMGQVPDGYEAVPDSPGTYVDADGNIIVIGATQELSSCAPMLEDVLIDLCDREGIDSSFVDAADHASTPVTGFKCAAPNGSAAEYIEALRTAYFFDRGEWDKQVHFPARGGASIASISSDDLVRLDENKPALQQTRIQEPELLRKVEVLTIDPDAGYNMGKQTWERRAGTIQARGEETVEIPVTADADETAQIAERRGKTAWAENTKYRLGLTLKYSKLTPTDIVTVTDAQGVTHRIRLQDINEAAGLFTVEEAVKDRQSIHTDTVATGTSNGNGGTPTQGLVGPTVFAVMNLPQLRAQDGAGVYAGAAGILAGWAGCQILLSVDGGVSYAVALTITRPTKIGKLTADISSGGTPLAIRLYGGDAENKTTAQVAAGANHAAVATADVAEVLNYEDATETSEGYWDLETLARGLMGTTAAAHVTGDYFIDLATCYFIPISNEYAGDTLYFKAVPFGVSADSITPVTLVYEGQEIIIDGGEIT